MNQDVKQKVGEAKDGNVVNCCRIKRKKWGAGSGKGGCSRI